MSHLGQAIYNHQDVAISDSNEGAGGQGAYIIHGNIPPSALGGGGSGRSQP